MTEKNNEIYRIGDLANLMGLSRDTLRYYEKRGILPSKKGENGYRYYTDPDICRMISVLYQRKMDFGLDDIETLWSKGESIDALAQMMDNRLKEEEEAIRRHQQTIARLRMSRNDCENIQNHLNQVILKDSPAARIVVPRADFQESVNLWFQYAQAYPGLDMMYLYDEYAWEQTGQKIQLDYKNTQLLLHEDIKDVVDYDFEEENCQAVQPSLCVSTFCCSENRTPTAEQILPMTEWARSQGLMTSRQLYCTFTMQGLESGQQIYYLQLYLPVF